MKMKWTPIASGSDVLDTVQVLRDYVVRHTVYITGTKVDGHTINGELQAINWANRVIEVSDARGVEYIPIIIISSLSHTVGDEESLQKKLVSA